MEHKASLTDWLGSFFHYALHKKKNFYWAWDRFLVVVRHKRNNKRILVLEVPLPDAPYLIQKHVDVSSLDPEVLANSLLLLAQHYTSSPMLPRNREYSVRFLSFLSFVHHVKKPPTSADRCATSNVDAPLLIWILQFLQSHGIAPKKQRPLAYFSLSQLRHEKQA